MSTAQTLRSSLETFAATSYGPQPKDIYVAQQWEMAGAHAMLMNGLLNIYEKSSTVPVDEVQHFVEYSLQWYAALEHHHHWEETIYYPMYSPKFNTDNIYAEHETFHAGVEKLKEYLTSCLPAGTKWGYGQIAGLHEQETFDDARFRAIIDEFVNELTVHLIQEISYLEPEKIRASGLTEQELRHISEVSENHMKSMPPFTFLIYTIIHTPKESGFPPVPRLIKNFLAPYVFYLPNRRLWQFAPKV